ncbi:MAG TPA: alpha/beta fold hydrolase [Pseudonocardia sp.]|nr:alpha/beta fold hydrolase [Pseudonocardia sp.]
MVAGVESTAEVAEAVANLTFETRRLLGLDAVVGRVDPAGFSDTLLTATTALVNQPLTVARAHLVWSGAALRAVVASSFRAAGVEVAGPAEVTATSRDSDPAYTANAWYYLCRQWHTLGADHLRALARAAGLRGLAQRKLAFLVDQVVAASAPENFAFSNPAVARRALETGGISLARGMLNLIRDLTTNNGVPSRVPPGRFGVGRELAVTPGTVVFRNELIELIQYEPVTDSVHEVPLLFSPPWINKYYILDLAPGRSLVEWALEHGHTCFMISYRNPDSSLRGWGLSDYLREGPLAALEVIEEITGSRDVNAAGLCLGGTLLAMASAWLAARGESRIRTLTLLNTMLDFSEPGPLGVFTDPDTVSNLRWLMRRDGYLSGAVMSATFDILRPTDLVWRYLVINWLLGDEPEPSDLIAWNSDATRMPETLHSEYLRACYVENRLANGTLTLAGERLELGRVQQEGYVVAAEADHIVPWSAGYASARLLGGPTRFVRCNAGHVAGVVNPPSRRRSSYRVSDREELPIEPNQWLATAVTHQASWWDDWIDWLGRRAGGHRAPPTLGSRMHPPQRPAPGTYVRQ